MRELLVLRYGELHLKGKNRGYFENALITHIKHSISPYGAVCHKIMGRYLVDGFQRKDEKAIISKLQKVFGLVSLSKAVEIDATIEEIKNYLSNYKTIAKNFRVSVKRADKSFQMTSNELEPLFGGYVIEANPDIKVKLVGSELDIVVEIRENKKAYILTEKIDCAGGMPVGTAGNGLLMLSGGIDSPVAGYMIAKRGMKLGAIHFHSFPYTSEQARQKVLKLGKLLEDYNGKMKVYIVSFTEIQEEIHKHCRPEFMITIMRRFMMRISERICQKDNYSAIITGENLGQVASQTIEGITSSNSVLERVPVLRPLIGFDKREIISVSEKIGTYETSILPYEDCCTVFLPKNPVIKPKIKDIMREEDKLDIELLINNALEKIEII